jgi:hypothetical protein
LFIILQQNVSTVKVENDIDVRSAEDPIDMKSDDAYIASTFSIQKAEPEVSHVLR